MIKIDHLPLQIGPGPAIESVDAKIMTPHATFPSADSPNGAGLLPWDNSGVVAPASQLSMRRLTKHQFRKEAELVRALSARWECLFDVVDPFPQHPVEPHIKREWPVGRHIADLLTFVMEPGWQIATQAIFRSIAKLAWADLMVLARLVQEPMPMERLKQTIFMQEGQLEASVASLQFKKLVIQTSDDMLSTAGDWARWLPHSLHLVEAKLEDWKEALDQALYYRNFADAVSIALPISFAGREDVNETCRAVGVGLILVPREGQPRIEVHAPCVPPKMATRKIQCSMQIFKRVVLDSLHVCPI